MSYKKMQDIPPTSNTPIMINERIISAAYMEKMILAREEFISTGAVVAYKDYVRSEVLASWLRSQALGYSPENEECFDINEEDWLKIVKENQLLLDIAIPFIDNSKVLAHHAGYTLKLYNADSIYLYGRSTDNVHTDFCLYDVSERSYGTTAVCLASRYKRPYQLIGPEHLGHYAQKTICSSAPILGHDQEVLGVVSLNMQFETDMQEQLDSRAHYHSLGWISLMALAIENQFKISTQNIELNRLNASIQKTNKLMHTTLEFIDEGIVTVDVNGEIIVCNQKGNHILALPNDAHVNIRQYFHRDSPVWHAVQQGKPLDYREEYIKIKGQEKPFIISTRPIFSQSEERPELTVLRFMSSKAINLLATQRSGTFAFYQFDDIVGTCEPIKNAKYLAKKLAGSDESILIRGESGTGKELFAQSIHNASRPQGPFIAVNCAAIPRNLIESELFGYEGGAFTGAEKSGRIGKIEMADGGTLFLDEIGDMPFEVQSILLRVLQNKQVMRVGSKRYKSVNFRLVTATNKNLLKAIQEHAFREDLYYRISAFSVHIPPLRERDYDCILLAEHFLEQYSMKMTRVKPKLNAAVQQKFLSYSWPGNVRQLENTIYYAVNVIEKDTIELRHLPADLFVVEENAELPAEKLSELAEKAETDFSPLQATEREVILNALKLADNKVTKAAEFLGVSKATMYRKINKLKIR